MRLFVHIRLIGTPAPSRHGGLCALAAAAATLLSAAAPTRAQAQDETDPRFVAPRRPLLDQLNRETRELYDQVKQGVVRVQLPPPRWVNNLVSKEQMIRNYKDLDPKVRRQIEEQEKKGRGPIGEPLVEGRSDKAPQTRPTVTDADARNGQGTYIVVPPPPGGGSGQQEPPRDPIGGGKLEMELKADAAFTPNNVGLVLPGGYVLVPLYVERETAAAAADPSVRVAGQDGRVLAAKFVGSDRQTNLTVVKLADGDGSLGEPVRLGKDKPEDGALVMMIAPNDGSGRLGLWTGGGQEFGVVFTTDGAMAGVARYGQFLTGSACKLIADQIIRHGSVKRATLGVIISEIREDDPLRQQVPVLGARTAMRVDQVMAGSSAEKAGLKPGDLLLALAGEAVSDIPSLAAAIAARSGKTELTVLRGEQVIQIVVDLQPK